MTETTTEIATLAGGCFWCLEAVFEQLEGVHSVESGYAGGTVPNPSYKQVSSGETGHAEAVQVTFDPAKISYRDLLEIFFGFHDPTTLNRQGADVGTQYRSAIFTHSPEQRRVAHQVIGELGASGAFGHPIVTEVNPLTAFYKAEGYHQGYYRQNADQPYCRAMIDPKIKKLRDTYRARLKDAARAGTQ